ncbi:MAG: hypothetical protein AAGE52_25230 [Myxococcota bacterium]
MVIAVALAAWAWSSSTWVAILAYVLGWLLLQLHVPSVPRWLVAIVGVMGALLGVRSAGAWLDTELLRGVPQHTSDRIRLERAPTIAPPVVFTDHPQRFVIHAPDGEVVRVRFGPRGATLEATALGQGVFIADYDPRVHGDPREGEGPSEARIVVDGTSVSRRVTVVRRGPHPRWFCRAPGGAWAATVSEETDELLLVSPDGRVRVVPVGDGPSDCAFLDDETIAVTHRFGPTLWLVGVDQRVRRRLPYPNAHRIEVSPDRQTVAIAGRRQVTLFDARSFRQGGGRLLHAALSSPDWLGFADDETLVVSQRRPATLRRIRRGDERWRLDDQVLTLGRPAVTMETGEGRVVVAVTDYRPEGEANYGNHFIQDQLLEFDARSWQLQRQLLTARRSDAQSSAGNVDRGVSPMGIELRPGGLRIAFAGTDEVWEWNGRYPPLRTVVDEVHAPHDVVTFASGAWSVSSPSAGIVATYTGQRWRIVQLEGVRALRQQGEHGFYEATRSGVSCQSCHLHADTDFVLRNIGGARLAPTLGVGGIAGTSPYLRDGSYPRVRDLNHLSRTLLRGFLRDAPHRGRALERFVYALPRRLSKRGHDLASVRRGLEVFVNARCPTCHAFPALTDLSQHPSATLFPEFPERADEVLDTPSLLSVGTHGPYLSDGRAETLEDVFDRHNESNRHGDTEDLTEVERADLIRFLESL